MGLRIEVVLQDSLYRGQRCIAAPLAQPVHGDVQSLGSAQHGSQRVGNGKIIIVMGMKIEVYVGVSLHHLPEILNDLQGIHHTQRVGQHEPPDSRPFPSSSLQTMGFITLQV